MEASEPRLFCKRCGYVLDGLESQNCPECGQPFDPDDPRSYANRPPKSWWIATLKRAALAFLAAGLLLVLLAFCGSMYFSKTYWGYFFSRPNLDRQIADAQRYLTITLVTSQENADGTYRLIHDDSATISENLSWTRRDPYYNLDERLLIELNDKGQLPDVPAAPDETLDKLYPLLKSTGRLVEGESGYEDSARFLRGIVVEAIGENNEHLLFVSVNSYDISNDHRVHYDFLFKNESSPKLISHSRFYFDVAGLEGLEWSSAFIVFLISGSPLAAGLAALVFIAVSIFRWWRRLGVVTTATQETLVR